MKAVLRIGWTFFTAMPLQRWLNGIGIVLCGMLAVLNLKVGEPTWSFVFLALFVPAGIVTLFASPAIFHGLSASRSNQLLPHFHIWMLAALAALMIAQLAMFALIFVAAESSRTPLLPALVHVFTFATVAFLLMFLALSGQRWAWWLWLMASAGFIASRVMPSMRIVLDAIPPWTWFGASLAAWTAFVLWYTRTRHIGQRRRYWQTANRSSPIDLDENVTRERALGLLLSSALLSTRWRKFWNIVVIVIVVVALLSQLTDPLAISIRGFWGTVTLYLPPVTSAFWVYCVTAGMQSATMTIVRNSRFLWLRIPGSREDVQRAIERAALRNFCTAALMLAGVAALYASPLAGASPRQVVTHFMIAACAGLCGAYAALSTFTVRQVDLIHFVSVLSLVMAQVVMFSLAQGSWRALAIVVVIQLGCVLLLRRLAIHRWRQIDWLYMRPPTQYAGLFQR
ncbi:MAG TPA: hypothetical protein PKE27_11505 [Povalibacter sp.]|uniref:hypothetical protein n=1 Tax=Povalibacter sp. TaxID=1962978 RepID=UPI002D07F6CC|nr:hypothetical protein [Povalibacter sp.]HMN45196.1 hypothetical protein [Povalibacter sp.]